MPSLDPATMLKKTAILLLLAIFLNAIAFICIWAYHSIVFDYNPFLAFIEWLLLLLLPIPLTFLSVKWLTKKYKVRHLLSPAAVFLLGFFIFLTADIVNQSVLASSTLDIQFNDTYFVIGHTFLMIFFALIFLSFRSLPKPSRIPSPELCCASGSEGSAAGFKIKKSLVAAA